MIAGGIIEENIRLQPWRYLSEVAHGLSALGHKVTLISDGACEATGLHAGVSTIHLPSVRNPFWRSNTLLQETLTHLRPNVILWHIGLSSFLHQKLKGPVKTPIIGIFTSPIYHFGELTRLGINKIASNYHFAILHLLGSLVPNLLISYLHAKNDLSRLVVQTNTTRRLLIEQGLWMGDIQVIQPGVDEIWCQSPGAKPQELRMFLGYKPDDIVIVYFGSPAPLRGLPTLIEAFAIAHDNDISLKLLILNRRREGEQRRENAELKRLVANSQFHQHIDIIDGFLGREILIRHVAVGDIIALPFELVSADAPLSLLEAGALGKPLVTTNVACLPELVSGAEYYLAAPADPISLSQALMLAVNNLPQRENYQVQSFARSWQDMSVEWSQCIQSSQHDR